MLDALQELPRDKQLDLISKIHAGRNELRNLTLRSIDFIWDRLESSLEGRWGAFEKQLQQLLTELANETATANEVVQGINGIVRLFGDYEIFEVLVSALEEIGNNKREMDVAGSESFRGYTNFTVLYVTDRERIEVNDSADATDLYGTDQKRRKEIKNVEYTGNRGNGSLDLGITAISIPNEHRLGAIEKPKWFRLQFREVPEKHVMLQSVYQLERDEFIQRSRGVLRRKISVDRRALIFIHGYNTTFTNALQRAAQVAYDLNYNGLIMLYSWPSEGSTHRYTVDESNIFWTRPHLKEFLHMALTELGVDEVDVIAHGMGGRALVENLADFRPEDLPQESAVLRQIVFVAPDVDIDTFVDLSKSFLNKARRYTLYASSNAMALELSETVHKYQRAGDSKPSVLILEGVDTIEAADVNVDFFKVPLLLISIVLSFRIYFS